MAQQAPLSDFTSVIVIDNIPQVPPEKFEKLSGVMRGFLNSFGCVPRSVELCVDEGGHTLGYAFVEYNSPAEAERAVQKLNNHRLDKNHIFAVTLVSDWERWKKTPEKFEDAVKMEESSQSASAGGGDDGAKGLQSWLLDTMARDQFLIRYGEEAEIYWNDPIAMSKQTLIERRHKWTDNVTRWSPLGTYLATLHQQGVQLWGGDGFPSVGRYAHAGVQLIDFSPRETFLVTWFTNLSIYDIKTQKRVKQIPGCAPTPEHGWPVFKWSHDEKFMATITEDNINIYDTRTMKLIQPDPKKNTTLYLPRVREFEWSPSDNVLAYWIPEQGELPAKIVVVRAAEKKVQPQPQAAADGAAAAATPEYRFTFDNVTQRNLFRVSDVRLHWSPMGEFLCAKVDRVKGKEKLTSFELFRMKSKPIGVEVVEVVEPVIAFAWEPKGVRFAVIHGSKPSSYTVSFYTLGGVANGKAALIKSLPNKTANHLFWSPKGNYICLAGLKNFNGVLEFWNANEMELTGGGEHFMCTDVEWDPSGRFVATSVSYYRHQIDNGYIVWTFQGRQLLNVKREKLTQFLWRPRPPSVLSENQLEDIRNTMKQRAQKYEKEEQMAERAEQDAINKKKKAKMEEFVKLLRARKEELKPLVQIRRKARLPLCGYASDDDSCFQTIEETVDEIISVEETEIVPS